MTTPQLFASIFAGSGILALILLLINFFRIASGNADNQNLVAHVVFAAFAGVSWVGFLISLVFVIIDYIKS